MGGFDEDSPRLGDGRCSYTECTDPVAVGVALWVYASGNNPGARATKRVALLCARHGDAWIEPLGPLDRR